MTKYSSAQIKFLYELYEEHPRGADAYWYFPYGKARTGDILVSRGVVDKDPASGAGVDGFRVGYRLNSAGRELIKGWDER